MIGRDHLKIKIVSPDSVYSVVKTPDSDIHHGTHRIHGRRQDVNSQS